MSEEDKVPSPDGVGVVPEPETVRRRPKWLAPVAAGCVLVLLAVGGVAGYRVWSARELAEAKEACAVAADGARGAANDYNAVVNGQAADASAVTVDQVKDTRTVDALAKALKTTAPEYEGCVAGSKAGLDEATSKLDRQAAWYKTHAASLGKAVKAVESSRLDRTVEDAEKLLADSKGRVADEKTRSMLEQAIKDRDADAIGEAVNAVDGSVKAKAKADADAKARREAEEKAQAEQEAQAAADAAAAQAQAQQQAQSYGAATRTAAAPATPEAATPAAATREEATPAEARTRRPRPEAATVGVPPPADQSAEDTESAHARMAAHPFLQLSINKKLSIPYRLSGTGFFISWFLFPCVFPVISV